MSLLELMNKTVKSTANRQNGIGSDIKYYSFETNSYTDSRAIISYDDFSKLTTDGETISDNAIFHGIELPFEPKKRDKIEHETTEWYVVDFIPNGMGLYDIYCEKNKRHTASTDRGRR
jgi:hypothetical protein